MGDFKEYLKEQGLNEGKKITVDVDWIDETPEETKKLLKKHKVTIKITGDSTADLTGQQKNLIALMKVTGHGEDMEELYPELFEGLNEGKVEKALAELKKLIKNGKFEFPDAEEKVVSDFKLSDSQHKELKELYDED